VFLTTDVSYALEYAKNKYLYMCRLKPRVNIFNALSDTDFHKITDLIITNEEENFGDYDLTREEIIEEIHKYAEAFKDEDWLDVNMQRKLDLPRWRIIEILRRQGYDGFFNYETFESHSHKPSVGLFHPQTSLKLLGRISVSKYVNAIKNGKSPEWDV
jgi:hypothetical protein